MNINIKKYTIFIFLLLMTVGGYADFGQIRVLKLYDSNGMVRTFYLHEIDSITFVEKEYIGENSVSVDLIKSDLYSALNDNKNSVVPTSPYGYQMANANTVDVLAGYTTVSRSDFQYGPELTHTYQWPNGYYGSACNAGPVESLYNAYTYAESLGYPEYKAIAQIIYAQTALHAVNNAGCLPYHDLRNLKASRPLEYLSMEDTYNAILSDLNEAIEILYATEKDPFDTLLDVEGVELAKGNADDAFSGYSWEKWIKLANTIKLRIALYLSKPNPALAQCVAVEALNDEIGVLDEDFGPAYKKGNTVHPYYLISASNDGGWADSRLNASFENIMKRTGSPLLEKYFDKNEGKVTDINTGKVTKSEADYYGIRQGTSVGKKIIGQGYYNFSEASVAFKYVRQAWVTKEEVIFMKAEAALRWGFGYKSAKEYYEEGIRSIFAKFDLSSKVDAYLAQTEVQKEKKNGIWIDVDYIDIYDSKNNLPGRLNICVAWDDNDSNEVKLEKIMTQKWMAIFPNGHEAWVDYRRTGYPLLFPSVQAWQGVPSFPVELQLRRIPHDESDENILLYDLPNIEQALSIYGEKGKNAGGQRLYFEGDPAEYPYVYDEVTGWFLPRNYDSYAPSSVEDNELIKKEIKIYPQPMKDYLIISGCKEGDIITITDISGKVIYNNVSTSNRVTIDVADYPNGVYIVKVGNHVEKIVK